MPRLGEMCETAVQRFLSTGLRCTDDAAADGAVWACSGAARLHAAPVDSRVGLTITRASTVRRHRGEQSGAGSGRGAGWRRARLRARSASRCACRTAVHHERRAHTRIIFALPGLRCAKGGCASTPRRKCLPAAAAGKPLGRASHHRRVSSQPQARWGVCAYIRYRWERTEEPMAAEQLAAPHATSVADATTIQHA